MKKYLLLLLALFAVASVTAQEFVYKPDVPVPLDTAVIYGKLDNGLTYYIMRMAEGGDGCGWMRPV